MKEKRKHERVCFGFKVEDASGKQVWMTEDISAGGCFLQTLEKAPVGTKISLVFQLPGLPKYIEAVGEVKHIRAEGMGIEFVVMDSKRKDETKEFVRDYLKFQKENKKK